MKKKGSLKINKKENNEINKELKAFNKNKNEVNNSLKPKKLPLNLNKMDYFIITGDYVPNDTSNFVFNLEKNYFVQHSENKEANDFINALKNEANIKIKKQQEQLNLILYDSKEEFEECEESERMKILKLKMILSTLL